MLLGGDEMGRTQQGNNNAYCQDNEITWYDWSPPTQNYSLSPANWWPSARPTRFRRQGLLTGATAATEIDWYTPAGAAMTSTDWSHPSALAVAIYLDGSDEPDRVADGSSLLDDDFLVLVNAWWQPSTHHSCHPRPAHLADRDRYLRPRQARRRGPAPRRQPADCQPPLDRRTPRPLATSGPV